jgi:hypothetical protein
MMVPDCKPRMTEALSPKPDAGMEHAVTSIAAIIANKSENIFAILISIFLYRVSFSIKENSSLECEKELEEFRLMSPVA